MRASGCNNSHSHLIQSSDSTLPDRISIEVGCSYASSATQCNLILKTQSTSSPIVHCVNDANCAYTGNQYYWCDKHGASMCLQCVKREIKKEQLSQQHAINKSNNKYHSLNHADYKPGNSKTGNSNTNHNRNSRKRKAESESNDKYEPANKKMKIDQNMKSRMINNFSNDINGIFQTIGTQQDQIKQLTESNQRAQDDIKKLQIQLEQKEKSKNILQKKVNDLNMQIGSLKAEKKSMSQIFERNKQNIMNKHNQQMQNLQKQIKENEKKANQFKQQCNQLWQSYNNMKTQNDALKTEKMNLSSKNREYENILKDYEEVKNRNMVLNRKQEELKKENNNLMGKNTKYRQLVDEYEKKRKNLADARDTWTYKAYTEALNSFLDGTN